eukprot:g3219.t1
MSKKNILETICERRLLDVRDAKEKVDIKMLRKMAAEQPRPSCLHACLVASGAMRVAAEFKRASPSKGDIATHLSASDQAIRYARAGASVISVLTEPTWFKGSLDDMSAVARAVRKIDGIRRRPLVLRKDFILDTYQILEARAHGADTVLIIVAAMSDGERQLTDLIAYARSLGMEPLVEVNSEIELEVAVTSGARVIGVNNRDLRTFQVDLKTTDRCAAHLKTLLSSRSEESTAPVVLMALSGVKCRAHVAHYETVGVRAVLVGEALMRAENPGKLIRSLIGVEVADDSVATKRDASGPLQNAKRRKSNVVANSDAKVCAKVCGIVTKEDALCAARSGADLIGLIFVRRSKRFVDIERAREIVTAIRMFRESGDRAVVSRAAPVDSARQDTVGHVSSWFDNRRQALAEACARHRPLVVGVFQNASMDTVKRTVQEVGLDVVQLHGEETAEFASACSVPTISVVHVEASEDSTSLLPIRRRVESLRGSTDAILLDTCVRGSKGGTGKTFDWDLARSISTPVILAGGLTPENVRDAVRAGRPWCVDVAGGVADSSGVKKDPEKVASFVKRSKEGE